MSGPCELKIKTPEIRVDLKGDAAFVRAGYLALRVEILSRLQAARAPADGARLEEAARSATAVGPTSQLPGPGYLWIYRCNDLYNKVYVLERQQLEATGLGRVVDLGRIRRIYIEGSQARALSALVPSGKTLWSELTGLGHERLRTS